ncbi:MAG: ABC transporter ATP-binding protein [Polyangia bacterium]
MAALEGGHRARVRRSIEALRLAWQSAPLIAGSWMALLALCALLPLALVWVGKVLIDAVVAHRIRGALWLVLVELCVMAAFGAAQRGVGVLRSLLGTRLTLAVSLRILRKALTLTLPHFQDPEFYDQLTRARREAGFRPLALAGELLNLLGAAVTLLGFIALLLHLSPVAVLALVLAAFPAALAELRFSREAYELRNQRATDTRRLSYLEYVLASDEHAKEVMMLGLGPTLLGRYSELAEALWQEERRLQLRRTLWVTLLSQLGTLSFYGCYLFIVWQAAAGRIGIGDMTLYVLAFRQSQQSFQVILLGLGSLYEHDLYMSNLLGFLARQTGTETGARLLPAARSDGNGASAGFVGEERGIRFEQVGFRYPGQDDFALRGIDLVIPAGQSLALVGHNGAGKTTFIKLLLGLYEPTEGRVLLDGKDLRDLPRDELRRRMAVVFQDFNHYQLTARENVAYGRPESLADEARIAQAIAHGGAEELIGALPHGLDTQLGRWFPGGVELSGGQWQRLALARSLMRTEADVLVLDEPTAALDVDAEAAVFEHVQRLAEGRTLLLISHRFANVRRAGHIVVLDRRGVVEQGPHDALMAHDGLYAAMFRKQASGYA